MTYDDAVRELARAPLAQFVAERKRLVGELRTAGDRDGSALLAKRARPAVSVWAVNQLYWQARDAFDAVLATGARLRRGELAANADHRDALAALRRRAIAILTAAGHSAVEATLRRTMATLAAIAAHGGFEPDLAGALTADRDPPGFELAVPATTGGAARPAPPRPAAPDRAARGEAERSEAQPAAAQRAAAQRAAAQRAEAQRADAQRAAAEAEMARRLAAARERLEAALRTALGEGDAKVRAVAALREQLVAAEAAVAATRATIADLERELAALPTPIRRG